MSAPLRRGESVPAEGGVDSSRSHVLTERSEGRDVASVGGRRVWFSGIFGGFGFPKETLAQNHPVPSSQPALT